MATRSKTAAPSKAPASAPKKLDAKFPEADKPDEAAAIAKFAMLPSVVGAVVVREYGKPIGELDLAALVDNLADSIKQVNAGDLTGAEGMLYAQAQGLQTIFMNLARRATTQEYMKNWEAYMRMALKAQNQCRMTLETLANIKNPPVVFARQANINNGGQQQVNNGPMPQNETKHAEAHAGAHAETQEPDRTELLDGRSECEQISSGPKQAARIDRLHR